MRKSKALKPSNYKFEEYCSEYPLCFIDFSFIDRHYHLLTDKFKSVIRTSVKTFRSSDYLLKKETNATCHGCPECIFGMCRNDLTDNQKSYIDNLA